MTRHQTGHLFAEAFEVHWFGEVSVDALALERCADVRGLISGEGEHLDGLLTVRWRDRRRRQDPPAFRHQSMLVSTRAASLRASSTTSFTICGSHCRPAPLCRMTNASSCDSPSRYGRSLINAS